MSKVEKKVIAKENWISSFNLIGEAKVNDFTFKIDEQSEKSNWIYNSMNLGIDCGERNGVVYCELMGGYSAEQAGTIFAHGKKEDGSDDFSTQIQVAWEDRFDDKILETIGDLSFITVGLEKTDKGKTFYKKFLSAYDAIAYAAKHLEEGMVVNVKGNLKYSTYNNTTQVRKNITSIVLSNADDTSKYAARFTQSILINSDSASMKNVDKDKSVMYVDARVLDYVKEINGIEVKGQYPYMKQFEFELDLTKPEICNKVLDKVFKVKKGVTQMTFEGEFIEGGAVVTATMDDVPDDIKDLIECGVFTEEEALARCSANGSREQRMILRKPFIRLVGEEKTPVLQKFEERYTEDELYLDYLFEAEKEAETAGENVDTSGTESTAVGDMSWLDALN